MCFCAIRTTRREYCLFLGDRGRDTHGAQNHRSPALHGDLCQTLSAISRGATAEGVLDRLLNRLSRRHPIVRIIVLDDCELLVSVQVKPDAWTESVIVVVKDAGPGKEPRLTINSNVVRGMILRAL